MIYFITNRPHYFNNDSRVTITDKFKLVTKYLDSVDSFAIDEEFNGLNPLLAIPLLTQVGDEHNQFVIDNISYPDQSWLNPYREKEWVGQNIKIDIAVATANGFDLKPRVMKIWDTMLFEQRVGLDSNRGNDLASIYERRCGKPLSKIGRERFTDMDKNTIFELDDILYAAQDVVVLPQIKKIQERYLKQWNLEFLMHEIEFPLVPILVKMEHEGININEEAWLKVLEDNKKELFRKELALDEELRKLGIHTPDRRKAEFVQVGLFGEDSIKTNKSVKNINYSSSLQIQNKIFKVLSEPIPRESKKVINKDTRNKSYEDKDTLQEGAVLTYMIENPKSIMIPFLLKYLEFKETEKEISSFGLKFLKDSITTKSGTRQIGYKRRNTGRVHTVYKQCNTKTGRLSSGDSKIGLFNSQQIPAIAKYRENFTLSAEEIANDWWLTTADLSGAETIIMCAFAKDKQLYKWAVEEDDLHSPMATLCWRAVYKFRETIAANSWATGSLAQVDRSVYHVKDSKNKVHVLTPDFKITKADNDPNKQMRTDFKAVTFGVIYGAEAKTIAKTLNISKAEAQVIINTIRLAIPDTFDMVMQAAEDALRDSTVVHNTRTNSRKWFTQAFKGKEYMDSSEISSVQSEARNVRIQGTQADMVKEAMVVIYRYFEDNKIEHCPIFQVHDELVWKHKGKEYGEIIPMLMGQVATQYLEGFTEMKASHKTLRTWCK